MKYIKSFENHSAYEEAQPSLILPNVSLCKQENEVHYNPYMPPPPSIVVAKFNVTDTSNPTPISFKADWADGTSGFSAIEIDGVEQPSVVSAYTFNTTGEHTVKYALTDPTSIGEWAFMSCSGLTSIEIPDSVTSIGHSAFNKCRSLTSIDIPSGVTSIGNYAFGNCQNLTSIVIPDGVTAIGNSAFNSCSGITSIDIPSGVTSIGDSAFFHCSGLTSIDIPDSVTSIGIFAFTNCKSLTSCTIGSGITFIDGNAFDDCRSLTSVICNATTPPTLGNYALDNTNKCPIYVPSGSVSAYQSASSWSTYTRRIQAIP